MTVTRSQQASIPTFSNGTHEIYNSTELLITNNTNYASTSLTCGAPYCHLICNEPSSCSSIDINASAADSLIIECRNSRSCQSFDMGYKLGPKLNFELYCLEFRACYEAAAIRADDTQNVYVECNHNATKNTGGPCYGLDVYADNAITANADCYGKYSCDSFRFYFDNAISGRIISHDPWATDGAVFVGHGKNGGVSHICNNTMSCFGSRLYGYNVSCIGQNACWQSYIRADESGTTQSLNLLCDGVNACGKWQSLNIRTRVYCPSGGDCNVICSDDEKSCSNIQFRIDNELYRGISYTCIDQIGVNDTMCQYSEVYCQDTTKITGLEYDEEGKKYRCNEYSNYDCCPFNEGNITCDSGSDCVVCTVRV